LKTIFDRIKFNVGPSSLGGVVNFDGNSDLRCGMCVSLCRFYNWFVISMEGV